MGQSHAEFMHSLLAASRAERSTGALPDGDPPETDEFVIDSVNRLTFTNRDGVVLLGVHHGPHATVLRLPPAAAAWLKDRL